VCVCVCVSVGMMDALVKALNAVVILAEQRKRECDVINNMKSF
jgi:hypothetical protein